MFWAQMLPVFALPQSRRTLDAASLNTKEIGTPKLHKQSQITHRHNRAKCDLYTSRGSMQASAGHVHHTQGILKEIMERRRKSAIKHSHPLDRAHLACRSACCVHIFWCFKSPNRSCELLAKRSKIPRKHGQLNYFSD